MTQLLKALIVLVFTIFFAIDGIAQYTFEMMNGRMLQVFSYNDSAFVDIKYRFDKNSIKNNRIIRYNENLPYELAEKKGDELSKNELDSLVERKKKSLYPPKVKEGFTEKAEVFAIHHPDGEKEILYEPNEAVGNYYSVPEMQEFIIGERDALHNFYAKRAFWGGVAVGAAGGFAWQNSIFTVTTPVAWTLITAIPTIRIKERYMSDPGMRTEPYKAGFARTARTRNMIQGLKGSLIGTVAGALIYAVVANNSPHFR